MSDIDKFTDEFTEELPKPIGDFILRQTDIKPIYTDNGAYYHYADVCKLLNRLKQELNEDK